MLPAKSHENPAKRPWIITFRHRTDYRVPLYRVILELIDEIAPAGDFIIAMMRHGIADGNCVGLLSDVWGGDCHYRY